MELEKVLARIPYLERHGLAAKVTPEGDVEVRMPIQSELTNHVGILHAGALFTAAETAAGVAAYRIVPDDRAFVLLRGATIRYTRRAESDVVATAVIGSDRAEEIRNRFEADQRADAEVAVRMVDAEGETVFEGDFDYALRPRRKR